MFSEQIGMTRWENIEGRRVFNIVRIEKKMRNRELPRSFRKRKRGYEDWQGPWWKLVVESLRLSGRMGLKANWNFSNQYWYYLEDTIWNSETPRRDAWILSGRSEHYYMQNNTEIIRNETWHPEDFIKSQLPEPTTRISQDEWEYRDWSWTIVKEVKINYNQLKLVREGRREKNLFKL